MLRHVAHRIQIPAHPSLRAFGWLSCIFCTAQGTFAAIFPLVLYHNLGNPALVGYYYALIGLVGFGVSIGSTLLFRKLSRITVMRGAFAIAVVAIGLMTLAKNIWSLAGLDIPRAAAVLLANISFALIISEHLKKALIAGQGTMFAWGNLGWLLGPLLGGAVASRWGYEAAFVASSILFFAALLYFLYLHLIVGHPHLTHARHDESVGDLFRNMRSYFKKPELARIFRMSFGINFWWAIRGIYIPLSIISFGFGPSMVGWIGALTGLPLIALESAVGRGAQIRGVRKYMFVGFALLTLFAIGFGLSARWYVGLFSLFVLANTAAALIDPLQNAYFFEVVNPEDRDRFFGIYNTGVLLAQIIAPVLGGLVIEAEAQPGTGFVRVWFLLAAAMALLCADAVRIRKKY